MLNTTLSGFLWGIIYYFINDAPSYYYYIVFGISVGFSSAALISLSAIQKIFYSFFIPMMGLSMLWMFSQHDTIHFIVGVITSIGIIYYIAFSYRYGKSFKQACIDREIIHANLIKLEKVQKELLFEKEKFVHLAHHDALTGLPNRLLFADRLKQAVAQAKRNKTQLALLFLDLDHFKEINDTFGHEMGDEILKAVTILLQKSMREEDTIARLGGDEFTIIINNYKDRENTSFLAQKIIDILNQVITIKTDKFYISCSIGISLFPEDGDNCSDLLKHADSAMYRAKEKGRNNFQFYQE